WGGIISFASFVFTFSYIPPFDLLCPFALLTNAMPCSILRIPLGIDCCLWDGVTCDGATGNVISLDLTCSWLRGTLHSNSSLFLLRHLWKLNLFGNDFIGSHVSSNMSAFATLTHLNLSTSSFSGSVPSEISRLSKLVLLDLSYNYFFDTDLFSSLRLENSIFTMLVQNLTTLRKLVLDEVNMSMVSPKSFANLSSSLTDLNINYCSLHGIFPDTIFRLPSLTTLNINYNPNIFGILPKFNWTSPLQHLSLFFMGFSGEIPNSISTLKSLTVLVLVKCEFTGHIPSSLAYLKQLQILYIVRNNFSKAVDNLTKFPYFLNSLKRLRILNLSSNRLTGVIPMWFWGISHDTLDTLILSNNIPSWICQFSSLKYLELSNNSLSGNLPSCFGNITNLLSLDLSSNKLRGLLPRSLVNCVNLSMLHLGHNEFSDIFPHWLEALQMYDLDLQSNKFYGPIPLPSPITFYYSIASNEIIGKISSLICNATKLEIIDLSNNSLMDTLPRCLTNFSTDLSVLNLRMNYLKGTIPQFFSSRSGLMTLDLSRNRFEGTLPRSLVKCRHLEVLDLSHNQIEDTFPRWLGTLPELKILVLRSNNLKDLLDIPKGDHLFSKLHILDLSNNNFSGSLPANLMMNLKSVMNDENVQDTSLYMTRSFGQGTYENSVAVMMKGLEVELVRILTFLTIIDLSCNSFQGNIPEVIGHLHSLVGLNLSHNHLSGSIPQTLGNLTNLGWLDLSSNKFSGLIPQQFGDLASLGYLNLSKNKLTGQIPQDKQLSTFSSDSFSGNQGLCGTPLPKACPSDAQPPPPSSSLTFDREGHESWFKQKIMWIGYASGIVIGISIAYIAFEMGRPKWLMQGVRILESKATEWIVKPKQKAIKFHGQ
ncbi:hypothetical protein EUGRSUZ_F00665, partial [Eucalyptus grandis]